MGINNLKLARLRKGIPQWQVAHDTGLPQSTVSRLENGRQEPSETQLLLFARALSVSTEDLRGREVADNVTTRHPAPRPAQRRGRKSTR